MVIQTPAVSAAVGATPVVAAPAPGTPEYDAAMVAKFENANVVATPNADPKAEKPANVPEKFWNKEKGEVDHDAWSRSTAELEAALTKSKQTPTQQQQQQTPTVDPVKVHADKATELQKAYTDIKGKADAKPEEIAAAAQAFADHLATPPAKPEAKQADADKVVESAGLKMDELRTEYSAEGKLSEASYAKLEKAGIDKDTVDTYIAGQVALAEKRDNEGYKVVGGQENFTQMSEWAKAALSDGEKLAFNKACAEGTVDEMKLAVSGLQQRYIAANGEQPQLLGGTGAGVTGGGYRSTAEMTKDMKDPRYSKDAAFRADVEAKVGRTTAF